MFGVIRDLSIKAVNGWRQTREHLHLVIKTLCVTDQCFQKHIEAGFLVLISPIDRKDSFDFWLQKDMRKSSSPSLSNCNSVLANKIFGIPLDELQQEGQPDNEVPFIVRHVVDYIEEHGMYHLAVFQIIYFTVTLTQQIVGFEEYLFSEVNYTTGCNLVVLGTSFLCSFCYVYHLFSIQQ